MTKRTLLSLTAVMVLLLLPFASTAAQDDPQVFPRNVTELHESVGWSAGGMVSTAPDLIAFARGSFGGALFDDPESLVAMTPASDSPYGLGIANQGEYIGHAGRIAGFRSTLSMRLSSIRSWWCSTTTTLPIPKRAWRT